MYRTLYHGSYYIINKYAAFTRMCGFSFVNSFCRATVFPPAPARDRAPLPMPAGMLPLLSPELICEIFVRLEQSDVCALAATCKSCVAVPRSTGFAALWRRAHPVEAQEMDRLRKLRRELATLDDEPLEVETSAPSLRSLLREDTHTLMPPKRTQEAPATSSAAQSMARLKGYFDQLDSFELEAEVWGAAQRKKPREA
jgi:hypothetical protein